MGCCEAKSEKSCNIEQEVNVLQSQDSFNEMNLSSDELRATTNPNPVSWTNTNHLDTSRPRSTSYNYSNQIEHAFLMNSPLYTKTSEATKSVLVPFSENSLELGVIKEEDKDITISFEEYRVNAA